MQFTKRLRQPVMDGEVTCSVRIWQKPHVKVGGHYALGPGHIEVTSLREIRLDDVTPALAKRSGFAGVVELLKVAKHGPGQRVFLVEFVYVSSERRVRRKRSAQRGEAERRLGGARPPARRAPQD